MPTPHNAAKKGEIAKTVLLPGDPLRAKFIADTYLTDVTCFNTVRNMLGFTGKYEGKSVSVMGGGMGIPSVSIYAYELYHEYDVDNIIRIGSAGGLQDDVNLMDVVIAQGACTDSNFAYQYELPGSFAPIASYPLLEKAVQASRKLGIEPKVGNVVTSDIFYNKFAEVNQKWAKMGALCVEMEVAGLYMNAAYAHKNALALLTISDHLFKPEELSSEERQIGFRQMMEIALNIV